MKFGEFPVYSALGVELTHDVKCQEKSLKKGHVLTPTDIGLLKSAGIKTVVGAIFDSEDIHPQTAADILLKAIAGDFLRYTLPDENGYSEIFADTDGVLVFEPSRMNRFNAHCQNISLISLPAYLPVFKGQFIANLRLYGPAIEADLINEAITKISGTGPLLKIAPYAFCKIAFIKTFVFDNFEHKPLSKKELDRRFGIFGLDVIYHNLCEYNSLEIEKHVRNAIDCKAEIILVECPFAPLHQDDVVAKGFKEAAADIDSISWPLDSGLSVVIAHKNNIKLLGYAAHDTDLPAFDRLIRFLATKSLPSCDVFPSLAVNGISLSRLGKRITSEQIKKSVNITSLSNSTKIAVVILAAGSSGRMVGSNKLLEPLNGLAMVEHSVRSALASKADYITVVTGYDAKFIEKRLEKYDVKIVRNPDFISGVLGSIRLGLAVLPPDVIAAIVLPADMPAFDAGYIDRMIDTFNNATTKRPPVVMPSYNGVRHNPVLWPKDLFKAVKIIPEDSHWSPALIEHSDYIKEVVLKDDLALTDINTKGDLEKYKARTEAVLDAEKDLLALENDFSVLGEKS